MRPIPPFRIFLQLSVGILLVYGLECHTSIPRHEKRSTGITNDLLATLDGPVRELCHKAQGLDVVDNQLSYSTSSGWTFQIHQDSKVESVEDCLTAFDKIVNGCVRDQNVEGGEILSETTDYFLTYMNDDGDEEMMAEDDFGDGNESSVAVLEARDPRGGRGGKARPSRPRPSRARPKKAKSKRPTSKKSKSKQKGKPKSPASKKGKPRPPKSKIRKPLASKSRSKSASSSASRTSSSSRPTMTTSCKKLALMDRKALLNTRDIDVEYGSMPPHTSGTAIEQRDGLQKRATKPGVVCSEGIRRGGWKFNARNYPGRVELLRSNPNARYYGFTDPFNCKSYQWSANGRYEPDRVGESEHFLEWQSVTGFIDWLDERYQRSGTQFQDPDTTSTQHLSFCKYIIKYWDLKASLNQESQYTFAIGNGQSAKSPVGHLASVYPSNDPAYRHEFVLLQKDINAPAKASLWTKKQIYAVSGDRTSPGMRDLMHSNPRLVILRLRWMVGARRYLTDARIGNTLVAQKTRMHDKFVELDRALPQHQPAGFRQWDPAIGDLAPLWDTYMDQAFTRAKTKQSAFVQRWIIQFRTTYCTKRLQAQYKQQRNADKVDLCDSYSKLLLAWKGTRPWIRPW